MNITESNHEGPVRNPIASVPCLTPSLSSRAAPAAKVAGLPAYRLGFEIGYKSNFNLF